MQYINGTKHPEKTILVLGGSGKTGRRVIQRLTALNVPVRIGSRAGSPSFDWGDPRTWAPALADVSSVYVSYYPDLAAPGASTTIRAFTEQAVASNVQRLVLLSGRGEQEAQYSERIVQEAGVEWTILRASWFAQNFSEGFLHEAVLGGEVALPAGSVGEPFVDVEDIADVAVAALTEPGHAGQLYELTGPRLLSFAEAIGEIAEIAGNGVEYTQISHAAFVSGLTAQGMPNDFVMLMSYLFTTVLDGRNEYLADGVQRALGREPRDFTSYVRTTAASGVWPQQVVHHG